MDKNEPARVMMEIGATFVILQGSAFIYFIYSKQPPVAILLLGVCIMVLIASTMYFYSQLPPVRQWTEDEL